MDEVGESVIYGIWSDEFENWLRFSDGPIYHTPYLGVARAEALNIEGGHVAIIGTDGKPIDIAEAQDG